MKKEFDSPPRRRDLYESIALPVPNLHLIYINLEPRVFTKTSLTISFVILCREMLLISFRLNKKSSVFYFNLLWWKRVVTVL